jgi:hypothetical protein
MGDEFAPILGIICVELQSLLQLRSNVWRTVLGSLGGALSQRVV